jgi:hypothetical protein
MRRPGVSQAGQGRWCPPWRLAGATGRRASSCRPPAETGPHRPAAADRAAGAAGPISLRSAAGPLWRLRNLHDPPEYNARRTALGGQLTYDGVAGERSALCDLRPAVVAARGSAATHASAIMRVLKDDLISIVAGCLSPAAGRGNTGPLALPLTGGLRWYGRAGGTLEDAGMWASSPHTTQSGSARSRMGPHLRSPVQLSPTARPPSRHPRMVPSHVPQSARDSGQAVRCARTHPPGAIPRVARKRMPAVSPESTGSRCERVPSAHAYAELGISIRDQQCSGRHVAEHWYPPFGWARSPNRNVY